MSSTRFTVDPDRIFPDHAYAPGYEPTVPELKPPADDILSGGDLLGFITAAGLVSGALAVVSVVLLWF